jgi:hypothetical protein
MRRKGADEIAASRGAREDRQTEDRRPLHFTGVGMRRHRKTEEMAARLRRKGRGDAGMVTSEYAMGIIAAVGFAVLLYEVVTSGQVRGELQDIVKKALSARM